MTSTASPYAAFALLYDALLGDRFFNQVRRNFERLRRHYGLCPESVADVACGTGTFVRYLAGLGLPRVYGVDRSAEMLEIAIAKNRGNGVCFFRQDFRSLHLPEKVDLITCNFDSLNYILSSQDLLLALRRINANLAPGGLLIFDLITQYQPWRGNQPRLERRTWPDGEFLRRIQLDPHTGLQTSLIRIHLGDHTYQERHRQRAYPLHVIRPLLLRARLFLLEANDFYTWHAVNKHTRRILFVAQKP